jgi:hypothetical protein
MPAHSCGLAISFTTIIFIILPGEPTIIIAEAIFIFVFGRWYGNASFKAYGKHSGEKFYTADIKITELLKYIL